MFETLQHICCIIIREAHSYCCSKHTTNDLYSEWMMLHNACATVRACVERSLISISELGLDVGGRNALSWALSVAFKHFDRGVYLMMLCYALHTTDAQQKNTVEGALKCNERSLVVTVEIASWWLHADYSHVLSSQPCSYISSICTQHLAVRRKIVVDTCSRLHCTLVYGNSCLCLLL
jgi:hypothetical protein